MEKLMERFGKKGIFAILIAALAVVVILIYLTVGRTKGGVTDETAIRNQPKAPGDLTVDQNVINAGNAAWQGQSYIQSAQSALNIVNQKRSAAGLSALRWDDNLAACAMVRATELPSAFSHTRPNGQDWYTLAPNVMYGENLAYGFTSADAAVNAWMNSPAHKQNILTPNFVSCGIGVYNANGTWYWGQEFSYY